MKNYNFVSYLYFFVYYLFSDVERVQSPVLNLNPISKLLQCTHSSEFNHRFYNPLMYAWFVEFRPLTGHHQDTTTFLNRSFYIHLSQYYKKRKSKEITL